ncbi:hypothetical protein ANANG_G00298980 [Anguilla anguilla]|uniref:Uncharacterized protein n=1 Tax=Anguilla anguilla TaxID=7936 RepID=A0A9D3LHR5_ANGAN|nr:hypothetical protein ANANG_G00298980 [Anguilla anguilla]
METSQERQTTETQADTQGEIVPSLWWSWTQRGSVDGSPALDCRNAFLSSEEPICAGPILQPLTPISWRSFTCRLWRRENCCSQQYIRNSIPQTAPQKNWTPYWNPLVPTMLRNSLLL